MKAKEVLELFAKQRHSQIKRRKEALFNLKKELFLAQKILNNVSSANKEKAEIKIKEIKKEIKRIELTSL